MYVDGSGARDERTHLLRSSRNEALKASSNSSRRPVVRAHLTAWILICKWNLNLVGSFAPGNLPAGLCFRSLSRRAPIIRTILLHPARRFLLPPVPSSHSVLSIFSRSVRLASAPPSACPRPIAIDLRLLFSRFWPKTFAGGRRTQKEPGMNFANGLNSNYPGVSFARSRRSAFSRSSLSPGRRPSLCATTSRKKRRILRADGNAEAGAGLEIRRARTGARP